MSGDAPLLDSDVGDVAAENRSVAVLRELALVYGRSGVEHSGGKVIQPWNKFTWREWACQADLMTLDPQVMQAFGTVQGAALAPRWEAVCADPDDPLAVRLAEAVREVWGLEGYPGLMDRSFSEQMADASWFLHYGAFPMEVRWAYDIRTGWDIPADLEPRIPSSIERWGEADQLGPITQIMRGDGRRPEPIPGKKAILFTLGKMGTDWTGRGKARAAWSAWKRRNELQDARQVGCNRLGVLPPVIQTSLEAVKALEERGAMPPSTYTTLVQQQADNLRRLQSGNDAVLASIAGVTDINWGTADNFDPAKILAAEASETDEIHAAYGTLFLRMGVNGEGNRSLGEVHMDLLRRSAVTYAAIMADALNGPWRAGGGLVGAFVELNFGKVDPRLLPRLIPTGLEADVLAEALGALPGLITAGLLTPDGGVEAAIRNVLNLQPLADDAERTPEQRASAGMAPAAAFARAWARKERRDG